MRRRYTLVWGLLACGITAALALMAVAHGRSVSPPVSPPVVADTPPVRPPLGVERPSSVVKPMPTLVPTNNPLKKSDAVTTATLHTTSGSIVWELLDKDAPKTVANMLRMIRVGVFNQSCFYRYERGFVLQGGLHCNKPPPKAKLAKNVALEYKVPNEKYTVALARAGSDLNSGGTEFFINLANNSAGLGPRKKGGYAVFARVISGFDTIAAMKALPTKKAGLTVFLPPQPTILWVELR